MDANLTAANAKYETAKLRHKKALEEREQNNREAQEIERCVEQRLAHTYAARRVAAKVSCFKMDWVVSLALSYEEAENEEYEVRNKRKRFSIT